MPVKFTQTRLPESYYQRRDFDYENENSATWTTWQTGQQSDIRRRFASDVEKMRFDCCCNHTSVVVELLGMIMAVPCFDELRTKQQLGYTASCGASASYGVR